MFIAKGSLDGCKKMWWLSSTFARTRCSFRPHVALTWLAEGTSRPLTNGSCTRRTVPILEITPETTSPSDSSVAARLQSKIVARARSKDRPFRVLILTADVGEGHDSAARSIATNLNSQPNTEATVVDGLPILPWTMRFIARDFYKFQVRYAPWSYGITYNLFAKVAPLLALAEASLYMSGSKRTMKEIRKRKPDAVISTSPVFTPILGKLRKRGKLTIPAYATITDLTGLMMWSHSGIDRHFVMYDESVPLVEEIAGPGSAVRVQPLVGPQFMEELSSDDARRELGLPLDKKIVLISGGGWGVGDFGGAVRAALEVPNTDVVCVCGRNEELKARLDHEFKDEPRLHTFGFTKQMNELMAASDTVIHSMGGVTCLEAQTRGCPVIAYSAPVGHALDNAKVMDKFGLVKDVRKPAALTETLKETLVKPKRPLKVDVPEISTQVVATPVHSWTGKIWRARAMRFATVTAAFAAAIAVSFSTEAPYGALAGVFHLRPVTTVQTSEPDVGLVIQAPEALVPALESKLSQKKTRASFAFTTVPTVSTLTHLRDSGDDALPQLTPGTGTGWIKTRGWVRREAQVLKPGKRKLIYLAPGKGFTLGQYLLARTAGATPVRAYPQMAINVPVAEKPMHRGQIVLLKLPGSRTKAIETLNIFLERLKSHRLQGVPVSELLSAEDTSDPTAGELATSAAPSATSATNINSTAPPNGV